MKSYKRILKHSLIILGIATGLVLWLYKYGGGSFWIGFGESVDEMNVSGEGESGEDFGLHKIKTFYELICEGEGGNTFAGDFGGDKVKTTVGGMDIEKIKKEYDEFKDLNDDLIGIVDVNGLGFNYPVMRSETPNYYLNHDLFKNYSVFGCPYMGEGYSIINKNIVIYGHCINKDKMFGKLLSLKNKRVMDKVKRICFYGESGLIEYEVVALLSINVDDTDYRYWEIKDFNDEREFDEYADGIIENGIYVNEEKLKCGNYLMLSTCDNELGGGYRIVLVGRMIENGIY